MAKSKNVNELETIIGFSTFIGQNVTEFETIKPSNYTYVSSQTLEPEFPDYESSSIMRQQPPGPPRRRSSEEMARLRKHPFFHEHD